MSSIESSIMVSLSVLPDVSLTLQSFIWFICALLISAGCPYVRSIAGFRIPSRIARSIYYLPLKSCQISAPPLASLPLLRCLLAVSSFVSSRNQTGASSLTLLRIGGRHGGRMRLLTSCILYRLALSFIFRARNFPQKATGIFQTPPSGVIDILSCL